MALCTLANLKTLLGIGVADTGQDTLLNMLIAQVSEDLARAAGRVANGVACLEKTTLTELFDVPSPRTMLLLLSAYPVVSITTIKESLYGGFASVDALTVNTDYQLAGYEGRLARVGYWLQGTQTIQVAYVGGYTAAGATPGTGEIALPQDIQQAAMTQAAYRFERRDKLGLTGAGVQGGSFSSYAQDDLLPDVRRVMSRYARRFGT